ncbi:MULTISPECIES: LuxR family transcriptional regulator [unclassified Microbacterium]|uniref:helix-turn-helix transcriptional regulator n=1 Tax=unclassified Microbacterium TaxID=2609290 RepID=UPI00254A6B87|nr:MULTISPECIES: LuxR family transcriptional regulator [unclassified Microbacterium]WIM20229.1 AAA family ATPase [Microbacterium sp. zg-B185]
MVAGARYRSDSVLVGRDRELALLRAALEERESAVSSTVIVEGEPGIGKTTLVSAAVVDLCSTAEDALVLRGACLPLASITVPFIGIRSAVRGLAQTPIDDDFLPCPPDLDGAPTRVPVLFDEWIDRITARRRVVITIDDLQWADDDTLDALMYLAAGPDRRPLTLVGTVRSPDGAHERPIDRWLAELYRMPRVEVLHLANLTREDTAEQISALLAWPADQSLVEDVYDKTRGHPYLTELTVANVPPGATHLPRDLPSTLRSAVLDAVRQLPSEAQVVMLVLAIAGRPLDLPALARVIAGGGFAVPQADADLGSLIDESLRAGVIVEQSVGFWFRHPLTAELIESGLSLSDRHRLHTVLSQFEETVTPTSGAELDHALRIADHHYRSGVVERAYASAVETSESARDAGAYPQELLLLLRALEIGPTIGLNALPRYELLCCARRAAQDAGASDDELTIIDEILTSEELPSLVRAEFLMRRMRLRAITQRESPPVTQCEAILAMTGSHPSSWQHARALSMWVDTKLETGFPLELATLERASESALAIARSAGDAQTLACALVTEGRVRFALGDRAAAAEAYTAAIPVALTSREWIAFNSATGGLTDANGVWWSAASARMMRARRHDLIVAGAPHVYVAWLAGSESIAWLFVGEWQECAEVLRFVAGRDPGPYSDAAARLTAARLAGLQGDQAAAEAHVARIEELSETHHRFWLMGLDTIRAEVRLAAHDPEGAFLAAMAGLHREEMPDLAEWLPPVAARALADLAEIERDRGQSSAAALDRLDRLLEAHPRIEFGPPRDQRPAATRQDEGLEQSLMVALTMLYASEVARARRSADEHRAWSGAVDALAEAQLPWEEAYACQRLAESLLRGAGGARRLGGARTAIGRGLALADRLHAAPVAASLRRLATLAHIHVEVSSGPVPPTPSPPGVTHPRLQSLTVREREVLAHIVAGETYAETAAALYISEKTVSSHVSHLLAKTGTSNRVELALLAVPPAT